RGRGVSVRRVGDGELDGRAAHFEYPTARRRRRAQHEFAAARLQPALRFQQLAHARRIDESDARQIDDRARTSRARGVGEALELLRQALRDRNVDLTLHGENRLGFLVGAVEDEIPVVQVDAIPSIWTTTNAMSSRGSLGPYAMTASTMSS